MAVVGGLMIFFGLVGLVVAVWALIKGGLGWANIANRKAAGLVLVGAFAAMTVGVAVDPAEDEVAVEAGAGHETTSTTGRPESTSTTTAAPTTTTTTGQPPAIVTTAPPTTPTTTAAPPVPPPPAQSDPAFGTLMCDAPGSPDNSTNTTEEWVEIVNHVATAVALTGWRLHDEGPNFTYVFPEFTLGPGAAVKVRTGPGVNTATDLFGGQNSHVWNNTGIDIAYLVDPDGVVVASMSCR